MITTAVVLISSLQGLTPINRNGSIVVVDQHGRGPTQRTLAAERAKWESLDVRKNTEARHPNVRSLQIDLLLTVSSTEVLF
jgi:hypothetical protein